MAPGIDAERLERSKDPRLRAFLNTMAAFLDKSGLRWAAFGSCAAMAHRGWLRRLTRDLDVLLPWEDFERLVGAAQEHGFEAARELDHFVRLRHDIFQVHAVPERFEQFDYLSGERLAEADTGVDWALLERRELRFSTGPEPVVLPVLPAATLFGVSLLRPLNVNALDDLRGLLTAPGFAAAGVRGFAERNPDLASLVTAQIERLAVLWAVPEPLTREENEALSRVRAALAPPVIPAAGAGSCPD